MSAPTNNSCLCVLQARAQLEGIEIEKNTIHEQSHEVHAILAATQDELHRQEKELNVVIATLKKLEEKRTQLEEDSKTTLEVSHDEKSIWIEL